jgi:hypothetical protein
MPQSDAVLGMWADIAAEADAEFNQWHSHQHIPERVNVPGFLSGRRYRSMTGRPRYFMAYEIEGLATAVSPAYVARLNDPTKWTSRMTPHFRNFMRTAFRVTARHGSGYAGFAATLQVSPKTGRDDDLRRWLTRTALPDIMQQPGIAVAQLWEADIGASNVETAERAIRGGPDLLAAWVVLVEAIDGNRLRAACRTVLLRQSLRDHGAAGRLTPEYFRLQHVIAA